MIRYRDILGRLFAGSTPAEVVADMHVRRSCLLPKSPDRVRVEDYMRDVLWGAAQRGAEVDPTKECKPKRFLAALVRAGMLGEED